MSEELLKVESSPLRPVTPVVPIVPKRKPFFMSKEEEYRQIRQCRYIRKTRRQQSDLEKFDFTSLFNNLPLIKTEIFEPAKQIDDVEKVNNKNNENDNLDQKMIEDINKNQKQEPTKKSESVQKDLLPLPKEKVSNRQIESPIKPVILHESQFSSLKKRDKLEPLLMRTDSLTKSPTQPYKTINSTKKLQYLYKEVSLAAKNANVDIANEKRDMQRQKETADALEAIWKSNKSKKRWATVRNAVKSGWLFSRKGRPMKLAKDRRKKRMLNEMNQLSPATISRRSVMKVNDQVIETSYVKRKIERQESLPCNLPPMQIGNLVRSPVLSRARTLSNGDQKRDSIQFENSGRSPILGRARTLSNGDKKRDSIQFENSVRSPILGRARTLSNGDKTRNLIS